MSEWRMDYLALRRPDPRAGHAGNTPSNSYGAAIEVIELVQNAESTVYPWKLDPAVFAETIPVVREYLRVHVPAKVGWLATPINWDTKKPLAMNGRGLF